MATEEAAGSAPGQDPRGDQEFADAELIGIAVENNYWRPEGSTDAVPPIDIDDVFRVAMHKVTSGLPLPADVAAGIEAIYHVMHERDRPEEFERLVQDDIENAETATETRPAAMAADHVVQTPDGRGDGDEGSFGSCSGGQAPSAPGGNVDNRAGDGGRGAAGQGEVSAGRQAASSEADGSRGTSRGTEAAAVREGLSKSSPGTAQCDLQSAAPPQQTGSSKSLGNEETKAEVADPASYQVAVDGSASGPSVTVSDPSLETKAGTEDKTRTVGSASDSGKCLTETGAQATVESNPQPSRTDAAQDTPNDAKVVQDATEATILDNLRKSSHGVKNVVQNVDKDCVAGKEGSVSTSASASAETTASPSVQGAQVKPGSQDNLEVSDMDLTQSDDDIHHGEPTRTAGCSSQASEDSSRASMEPIVEGASPISSDDEFVPTKKKRKWKKSQQHRRRDQRKRAAALHAKLDLYRQERARLESPSRLGARAGWELSPSCSHDQPSSQDGRRRPYIIVPKNARPYCLEDPRHSRRANVSQEGWGRSTLYFPDSSRSRSPTRRSSPGRHSRTPRHQRRSLDSPRIGDSPRISVDNIAFRSQSRSERPRRFNFAETIPSKSQSRFCSAAVAALSVSEQLQIQRTDYQPMVHPSGDLIPQRRTLLAHVPQGFINPNLTVSSFQDDNVPTTVPPPDYTSAGEPSLYKPSDEAPACYYAGSPLFPSAQNSLAHGGLAASDSSIGTSCSTATSFAAQVHVAMTATQAAKVGSEEDALRAIASEAYEWAVKQKAQLSETPQSIPASSAMSTMPEAERWTETMSTIAALPATTGETVQSDFSSDITPAFTVKSQTFPKEVAVPSLQNTAEGAGKTSVSIQATNFSQLSRDAVPDNLPGPCLHGTGAPAVAFSASAMEKVATTANKAGQTMASLDGATMTSTACPTLMQAVPVSTKLQASCQILRDASAPVVPLSSSRRPGRWDCPVMPTAGTKQHVHLEMKVVTATSTSQPSLTHAFPEGENNVRNNVTQQKCADSGVSTCRDPAIQVAPTFLAQPQTVSTVSSKIETTVPNAKTTVPTVTGDICETARDGERMKPAQDKGRSASTDSVPQLTGHATYVSNVLQMPAATTLTGDGPSAGCSAAELKERPISSSSSSSSYLQSQVSQTLSGRTSAGEKKNSNMSMQQMPRQPGLLRQSSNESRTSLFEMFTVKTPASSSPCPTSTGVTESITSAKPGSVENQVSPQPHLISDVSASLNSSVSKGEKDTLDSSAKSILHVSKTQQSLSTKDPALSRKCQEFSSGSADERKSRKSSADGLQGVTKRDPTPVPPPVVPALGHGMLEGLTMSISVPNTVSSVAMGKLPPTIPLPVGLPRFLPVPISLPVESPGKASAHVSAADRGSSIISPRDPRLRKRSVQNTSANDPTYTILVMESTKVRPPLDNSSKNPSAAGMLMISPGSHAVLGKAQDTDGTALTSKQSHVAAHSILHSVAKQLQSMTDSTKLKTLLSPSAPAPHAEETWNREMSSSLYSLDQTQRKLMSTSSTSDRPKLSVEAVETSRSQNAPRGSKETVKANTFPTTSADSAKVLRASTQKSSSSAAGVKGSASKSGSSVAAQGLQGKPSAGKAEDLETARKALLQNINQLVSTLLSTQKPAKEEKDHADLLSRPKQTQQYKHDTSTVRILDTEKDADAPEDEPVGTPDLDRKIEEDIIRLRRKSGLSGSTNVSTGDISATDAHHESTLIYSDNSEETSADTESQASGNVQSRTQVLLPETNISSAPSVSSSGRSDIDDTKLALAGVEKPTPDVSSDVDKEGKEQSSCTDQEEFKTTEAKSLTETSLAPEILKHYEHQGNAQTEAKGTTKKEDSSAQVEEQTESPALPTTQDMSIQTSDPEELEDVVQKESASIMTDLPASPCTSPVTTEQQKDMLSSEAQTSPDGPKASPETKKETSRQHRPCSVQTVDSTKELVERVDTPAAIGRKSKTARTDGNVQTDTKGGKETDVSRALTSFPDSTVPSDGESAKLNDAGSHKSRKSSGTKNEDTVRSRSSSSSRTSEKAIASPRNSVWDFSDDSTHENDLEEAPAGQKRLGLGRGARLKRPLLRDVSRSRNLEEWRRRYWLPAHRTTANDFMAEEEEEVVSRRTYRSLEMRRASHVVFPSSRYQRWPPPLRMDRETHFDDRLLHEEWDRSAFSEHRRLSFDRDYRRTGFTDLTRRGFQHDIRDPSPDPLARRRDSDRERWPHDMFEDYSASPHKRRSLDRDGALDRPFSQARRPFRAREAAEDFSSLESPAFLVTPSGKIVKMSSTYIKQVLMKDGYLDESVRRRLVDQDSAFKKEAEPERKRPRLVKPSANVAAATKIKRKWFRELYFPTRTWPARKTRAPRAAAENKQKKMKTLPAQPESRHNPRSSRSSDRSKGNPRSSKSSDRSKGNLRSSKSSDRSKLLTPTHRHTRSPESSKSQKLTPGKSFDVKKRATPKTDLKGKCSRSRSLSRDRKKPRVEEPPQSKSKAASHQRMRLEWTSRAAMLKARIAKLLAANKIEKGKPMTSVKTEKTNLATANKPEKTKEMTTSKRKKTKEVTTYKPEKGKLGTKKKPEKTKEEKPAKSGKAKPATASKSTTEVMTSKSGKAKPATANMFKSAEPVITGKARKSKLVATFMPEKTKPETISRADKVKPEDKRQDHRNRRGQADNYKKADQDRALKSYSDLKVSEERNLENRRRSTSSRSSPVSETKALKAKSRRYSSRRARSSSSSSSASSFDKSVVYSTYAEKSTLKTSSSGVRKRSLSPRRRRLSSLSSTPSRRSSHSRSTKYSPRRHRSSSTSSSRSSPRKTSLRRSSSGQSSSRGSSSRRRSSKRKSSRRSPHRRSSSRDSSSTRSSSSSESDSDSETESSFYSDESSKRHVTRARPPLRPCPKQPMAVSKVSAPSRALSDIAEKYSSPRSSYDRRESMVAKKATESLTSHFATVRGVVRKESALLVGSTMASYEPSKQVKSSTNQPPPITAADLQRANFQAALLADLCKSEERISRWNKDHEKSRAVAPTKPAVSTVAAKKPTRFVDLFCEDTESSDSDCYITDLRDSRSSSKEQFEKNAFSRKGTKKKPTESDTSSDNSSSKGAPKTQAIFTKFHQNGLQSTLPPSTKPKVPQSQEEDGTDAIFKRNLPTTLEEAVEAKRPKMVPIQIIFKRRPAALRPARKSGNASSKTSPGKSKAGETSSTSSERKEAAVTTQSTSKNTSVEGNFKPSQTPRRLQSKVVPINKLVK